MDRTLVAARGDENGFIRLDSAPQFSLGKKVRAIFGVFVESPALYDGMPGRDRVAILLDLPGGKVRVSLGADLMAAT
jgi:hypothetical protein